MDRRQYLRRLGGTAGLGLLAATAGCGSDGGNGDTTDDEPDETTTSGGQTTASGATTTQTTAEPATATSEGATVTMQGFSFSPVRLSSPVGATVEWTNEGGASHTVVAADLTGEGDDWTFDEQVSGGATTSHTFESGGVYEYFCDIHGQGTMCGVVLVGDATLSATLPCE